MYNFWVFFFFLEKNEKYPYILVGKKVLSAAMNSIVLNGQCLTIVYILL